MPRRPQIQYAYGRRPLRRCSLNWGVPVDAQIEKRACIVYVAATAGERAAVRKELEGAGYVVCEVKAEIEEALAAKAGQDGLREELAACIGASELCVFLLPEDDAQDGEIGTAAGYADGLGKRLIGVVAGARTSYPDVMEDFAPSMIRVGSERLAEAIAGADIWEAADRSPIADRKIRHVRCQS